MLRTYVQVTAKSDQQRYLDTQDDLLSRKEHGLKQTNFLQWYSKVKSLFVQNRHSSPSPFVSDLSNQDAAETNNRHFAAMCQTMPSLDLTILVAYLPSPSPPPNVHNFQVTSKLLNLKKERFTIPIDLPAKLCKEFVVELAIPLCSILNASLNQYKCPSQWKPTYVALIPKAPAPHSASEL